MAELPPLPPIDTEEQRAALYRANRRRHATLPGHSWPSGVLAECERLDDAHPGWSVTWLPENRNPGWERPAGYNAMLMTCVPQRKASGGWEQPQVFATTVPELEEKMSATEELVAEREAQAQRIWRSLLLRDQ